MVVIKIGGTNGSGKTSVVRALLSAHSHVVVQGAKKPEAYKLSIEGLPPVYVLGSYENVCGGMDGISDKHERLALVRKYAKGKNVVIYEGLITGKTYGAMGALSEERGQWGRWVYAFMDTPFEVCVERVMERRIANGNDAPFDPERTMRSTHKSCLSTAKRAGDLGHAVLMLNHKHTPRKQADMIISVVRGKLP